MSQATSTASAEEITQASKSNLALAFVALPPERRADISIFYAYCRIIDDIADEETAPAPERQALLQKWRRCVVAAENDEPAMAAAVRRLREKYQIPAGLFQEVIDGCAMDLAGTPYETWEDLRLYCYRVASVVGLVSIEIFGYRDPRCREYAVQLGLALQLTNIIRDVGVDWQNGERIYLPRAEMAQFGLSEEDLRAGREDERLQRLLEFQAARAEELYASAQAALPAGDRRSMVAAEIMRTVYYRLLGKIRRGRFRVLHRRFRLSKLEKLACIVSVLWQRRKWPKSLASAT